MSFRSRTWGGLAALAGTIALVDLAGGAALPGALPHALSHALSRALTAQHITITPGSTLVMASRTHQFTAVYYGPNGSPVTRVLSWTVSNEDAAGVTSAGLATGYAAGTTSVIASTNGVSGVAKLIVTADTSSPPPADTSTGGADTSTCNATYSGTALRTVNVTNSATLQAALSNALAGDYIHMADGSYTGVVHGYAMGTATHPIVLCGSRRAVLSTGGYVGANTVYLKANYWIFDGFKSHQAASGLLLQGASHNTIQHVEITDVGQGAIRLKGFSVGNLIQHNYIHVTGRRVPALGEAIYVGSTSSEWCANSNCVADASDSNTVRYNTLGPNVTAQFIDLKDGEKFATVTHNTMTGTGHTLNMVAALNAYGDSARVDSNTMSVLYQHGVKTAVLHTGWSRGNVFHGNAIDMAGALGLGFSIGAGTIATVACTNNVTNGTYGVTCAP